MIFNIQRFSTHDGAGVRTNIFFKGCPLRCKWCCNPESQNFAPEIFFNPQKCILCLECVNRSTANEFTFQDGKISFHKERLQDAGVFRDICPCKAIEVVGREADVNEILEEVIKDLPFYHNSGGGVTISGGEPFFQPELLEALTKSLKILNIHVSVETCLDVPWRNINRSAENIDVFLADLKHIDRSKFREYTDGNLDQILSNFKKLESAGTEVIARIPVIPGFNDTIQEMHSIIDFAAGLKNVTEIHFLMYHTLGTGKYNQLGRAYDLNKGQINDDIIQDFLNYAINSGLNASIGG